MVIYGAVVRFWNAALQTNGGGGVGSANQVLTQFCPPSIGEIYCGKCGAFLEKE